MDFVVKTTTIFNCSLSRAFKTPMLCDVTKVHTGKGIMPAVTHCTEDESWGKEGSSKKVHVAKSLTQKGGFGSMDNVVKRIENRYWKIEVNNFQTWMLGFYKFVGEWETIELDKDKIQVNYTYTLAAKGALLYPFQWLFAKLFWKGYMHQVLQNIHQMAKNKEPYLFE